LERWGFYLKLNSSSFTLIFIRSRDEHQSVSSAIFKEEVGGIDFNMIKNKSKYLKECAQDRKKYLQGLTYRKSAMIMEQFFASRMMLELDFTEDLPVSLSKLIEQKQSNRYRPSGNGF